MGALDSRPDRPIARPLGEESTPASARPLGGGSRLASATASGWLAFAAYLLTFAVLLWRIIANAEGAFGRGNHPVDSRLLAWTQAAVATKLRDDPRRVFDAPIFHPAEKQLAGGEHYLSSQIVFGPVFWLTGNAVLATNVLILVSYPLAAIAMNRLLMALGASGVVAWVMGLVFALGPLAVPVNVQVMQYLIVYLPLIALTLRRLREHPAPSRAGAFLLVSLFAAFSSYYMAALAMLVAAVWAASELVRDLPGRARFLILFFASGLVVGGLLTGFSLPYLERHAAMADVQRVRATALASQPAGRPTASGDSEPREGRFADPASLGTPQAVPPRRDGRSQHDASAGATAPWGDFEKPPVPLWVLFSWPPLVDTSLVLALAGLAALGSRAVAARRLAAHGSLMTGLGVGILALFLSGALTPLPAPLAFFRNPFRATAVTGFGVALLGAATLEAGRALLPQTLWRLAIAVVLGAVLLQRGTAAVSPSLDPVRPLGRDATIYRRVGETARQHGGGPLLELPTLGPRRDALLTDSMVASTLHGLPLITGFGPMFPMHWRIVERAIGELPSPEALQDLVDVTGLRWVLLRPEADWPSREAREKMSAALAGAGSLRELVDGITLQRVDLPSRHPEFARAVARGYRSRESVLGTPYEDAGAAPIQAGIAAPKCAEAAPGGILALAVRLENSGATTWPSAWTGNGGGPGEIYVAARWDPLLAESGDPGQGSLATDVALRRDLPGGEELSLTLLLPVPEAAGTYELRLDVRRRGGAAGDPKANPLAVVAVAVGEPATGADAKRDAKED